MFRTGGMALVIKVAGAGPAARRTVLASIKFTCPPHPIIHVCSSSGAWCVVERQGFQFRFLNYFKKKFAPPQKPNIKKIRQKS